MREWFGLTRTGNDIIDKLEPVQRQIFLQLVTKEPVVPLPEDRDRAIDEAYDPRRQDGRVLASVVVPAVREESRLPVKLLPVDGGEPVPVALVHLRQRLSVRLRPRGLEVAHVRREVLPVVALGVVLLRPGFIPLLQFRDLVADFAVVVHAGRYVGVGYVLGGVELGFGPVGQTHGVVVVTRRELHSVDNERDLSHADGAEVVRVVVGVERRGAGDALGEVRLGAESRDPDLFGAGESLRPDALLGRELLHLELLKQHLVHALQLQYIVFDVRMRAAERGQQQETLQKRGCVPDYEYCLYWTLIIDRFINS